MADTITKETDTQFRLTQSVSAVHPLAEFIAESKSLQIQIDALTAKKLKIDDQITQAKALGVKEK